MPYLRATSVGVSTAPRLSATISLFCSSLQTRRRSLHVITSTGRNARSYDQSYERPRQDPDPKPVAMSMISFDHGLTTARNRLPPRRLPTADNTRSHKSIAPCPLCKTYLKQT
jgi:hypothetical protein